MRPPPGETICDPACGTGGFLLAAHEYVARGELDRDQKLRLKRETLFGVELVDGVARLAAMNLLLHGISGDGVEVPIAVRDSLGSQGGAHYDLVLTNPPFGRKSSVTIVNQDGRAEKESLTG